MQYLRRRIGPIVCVAWLTACSYGCGGAPTAPAAAPPPNLCPAARPEICTQEYVGVCGILSDDTRRTYATGCTACADPNVVGWQPGECD